MVSRVVVAIAVLGLVASPAHAGPCETCWNATCDPSLRAKLHPCICDQTTEAARREVARAIAAMEARVAECRELLGPPFWPSQPHGPISKATKLELLNQMVKIYKAMMEWRRVQSAALRARAAGVDPLEPRPTPGAQELQFPSCYDVPRRRPEPVWERAGTLTATADYVLDR